MLFKTFKKVLYVFTIILCFPIANLNANMVFPESLSQDVFSFNKTTNEEYLELADFLTGEDMVKYYFGTPFSFENREDALSYALYRNVDGSAKPEGKATSYTIRCTEQNNSIIGQITLGPPKYGSITISGDDGEIIKKLEAADTNLCCFIGRDFQNHGYAFRAIKAFTDEFFKLNEKSDVSVTFLLECNPKNIASLKTIQKLGAVPRSAFIDEYRYYKKSISDTMCEVKTEITHNKKLDDVTEQGFFKKILHKTLSYLKGLIYNKKLCDVSIQCLPKKILHKSLLNLKEGECLTIQEYKFSYYK